MGASEFLGNVRKFFSRKTEVEPRAVQTNAISAKNADGLMGGGQYDLMVPGSTRNIVAESLHVSTGLVERYIDYENMDDYPELTAALNVYADDATIPDGQKNSTVWAVCKDKTVKAIIDDLLARRIRIEDDVHGLTRMLGKYGDHYAEKVVSEKGVQGLNFMDPPTVRRIQDRQGSLMGYVQCVSMQFGITEDEFTKELRKPPHQREAINGCVVFEPWEVVHWRVRGKNMRSPYGVSLIDSARWIWKRLMMLEDAEMVSKLTRAPARFAFYVNTGDLPIREAHAEVRRIRNEYRKKKLINPATGQLDFRFDVLSPHDDFWFPVSSGGDGTKVDVLAGPDYSMIESIEYFRTKLVAATSVPRRYLGLEEGGLQPASREDVKFARAVMRLQREVRNGLKDVVRTDLAILGIDPDSVSFDLRMTVPSYIFELAQIEVRTGQATLAQQLQDFMPRVWIRENVFGMSHEEASAMDEIKRRESREDSRATAETDVGIQRDYPELNPMVAEEGVAPEEEDGGQVTPEEVEMRLSRLESTLDANVRMNALAQQTAYRMEQKVLPTLRKMVRQRRSG
jgi:hypothetical protein